MRKRKIALGLLGVSLVAYAVLRVYLVVAIRSELTALRELGYPATAAELNAWYATPPEGENAADEYFLAFENFTDEGIDCELLPVSGPADPIPLDVPLPPDVLTEIGRYIEVNAVALEHLHRAAQMPDCRWSWDFERPPWFDPEQVDTLFVSGKGMRRGARMLKEEALYFRDIGDTDSALRSVVDILGAGAAHAGHPSLIFYLTAFSIDSMAFDSLQNLAATSELTDAQLAGMQHTFREAEERLSLAPAILGEALMFKPALDMMSTWSDPALDEAPYGLKERALNFVELAGLLMYRYSGAEDSNYLHILRGARYYIALCALPPQEAIQRAKEPFPNSVWGDVFETSKILIDMNFAVFNNLFGIPAQNKARFRIVDTAFAVERYRLEYDRLPDQLEELVPAYLAAVPVDPFDGEPLRYRREDGGFVVYSIGRNLIDEDGHGSPNMDGQEDDIVFSVFRKV